MADDVSERLLTALDDLDDAAALNVERGREIRERVKTLRAHIKRGGELAEFIEREEQPRTVELITANLGALETFGSEFRAAQAHALRAEGMTIEAIGNLFGVSRQRVSALLKQKA